MLFYNYTSLSTVHIMLAEPKSKKLKWSTDPQNTAWANDKTKFCFKMMEQMGWKEGEGLGKNNDGMKDYIEIKPVIDNRGLGCSYDSKSESQHQPDYEEILRSLNEKYSTKKLADSEKSRFPLEQGAAKSRPLRYRKSIQAKDLSNKSRDELSCLFITHPSRVGTEGSLTKTNELDLNDAERICTDNPLDDLTVVSKSVDSSPCDILLKNTRNKRSRKHLDN